MAKTIALTVNNMPRTVLTLTDKQKQILIDNMFDEEDDDWIEGGRSSLLHLNIAIASDSPHMPGWWDMYVNGHIITQLNFGGHSKVLDQILLTVD